ncbi:MULTISPECIES: RNA polymerase sigma factor [unclassified Streptomyces]|uniref:RNA polymerase sigma factor n=1 Tax=unclassified Streptomyces TaxID=2593676 RepID=UPI002E31C154|nr:MULTISPECIES: sigma-70 family RNA polymerase sigma factor [unclassified Streptomyces]WUC69167.1 sigma-70 family RNA polymerase sigma factor [Streptomyces sp. NBC_00539]
MPIGDPFYPCCTGAAPAQVTVLAPRRAAGGQVGATPACSHQHHYVPFQLSCGLASAYQPRTATAQEFEKEFVDFLEMNVERLFRIAFRQEKNYHRSQDALQLATEKLWLNWKRIRCTVENTSRYASSCVIRSYYDLLRRERSENGKSVKLRLEREVLDREYLKVVQRMHLAGILKILPARQRDIVTMRYFEEMQVADIAAELNISVSTVGREEKKAMALLREAEKQE